MASVSKTGYIMELLGVSLKQRDTCQSLPKEAEARWAHGISGDL